MELFYIAQLWTRLFEVARNWMKLLQIAKNWFNWIVFTEMVPIYLNVFIFTQFWMKLFSFAQI